MVTINRLELNSDASEIDVTVSNNLTGGFYKAVIWNIMDNKEFDISHLLSKSGGEVFKIPAEEMGLQTFTGIFKVKFYFQSQCGQVIIPGPVGEPTQYSQPLPGDVDCDGVKEEATASVINTFAYYQCLIDKSLSIPVSDCTSLLEDTQPYLISILLSSLELAFLNTPMLEKEAVKIMERLEDICNICGTCPQSTIVVNSGTAYRTINNALVPAV